MQATISFLYFCSKCILVMLFIHNPRSISSYFFLNGDLSLYKILLLFINLDKSNASRECDSNFVPVIVFKPYGEKSLS